MLGKVLIVDDSMMIHQMYKLLLMRYEGCELLSAKDGSEGLGILDQNEDIDLVLLDMNMPGMTGCEFLAAMKEPERDRDIPVVVISSKEREECDIEHLSGHINGFINKRFVSEGIHRIIGELFPDTA